MAAVETVQRNTRQTPQLTEQKTSSSTTYQYERTYAGNTGNNLGISTAGYRTGKYNPDEWHSANYAMTSRSTVDREAAGKVRMNANDVIKETEALSIKTQAENTKRLAERLHDINFWKSELQREITDMISETDLLCQQKKRLENALRATEIPLHIATDNLHCRQRRQGIDLVQDDVELNLLKEVEVINNVQDLLRRTIKESEFQIKRNRDEKQKLEMDWSDKKEADELDTKCAILRNEHTNKQFYPGAARFQEIQSTPESWAQYTHDNITRAEHERMASIQLRTLIDNVLNDTSRDMHEQADAVDSAFQHRILEVENAKAALEDNLKKVCNDISQTEKSIADLKKAILDKEDPMKVAQTRLHTREFRPKVELCRDPAQYGLVDEVHQLSLSVDALLSKLNDAELSLKNLQDQRMAVEKDISNKKNTLFIDREKSVPHRTRYPTITQLQGYQ
jgi:tektin-4